MRAWEANKLLTCAISKDSWIFSPPPPTHTHTHTHTELPDRRICGPRVGALAEDGYGGVCTRVSEAVGSQPQCLGGLPHCRLPPLHSTLPLLCSLPHTVVHEGMTVLHITSPLNCNYRGIPSAIFDYIIMTSLLKHNYGAYPKCYCMLGDCAFLYPLS